MADEDKKNDEKVDTSDEASTKLEEAKEEAQVAAQEATAAPDAVEESAKEIKEDKPQKPQVKVSKKLEGLIEDIEKLSVLELSDLVKALEEKFGVSAAAPMAVAAVGAQTTGSADEGVSEQTTFNVILADGGANKISVIKAVREIVPTLGLKEAKDLVDAAPKPVLEGANKDAATEAKTKLEAAGAKVELK